jgi:hypothetical protein
MNDPLALDRRIYNGKADCVLELFCLYGGDIGIWKARTARRPRILSEGSPRG